MPFKDPAADRAYRKSLQRKGYERRRERSVRTNARRLRRLIRAMSPDRLAELRALLTADEDDALEAFAFRPVGDVPSPHRR